MNNTTGSNRLLRRNDWKNDRELNMALNTEEVISGFD
jgi:hypothetical protein